MEPTKLTKRNGGGSSLEEVNNYYKSTNSPTLSKDSSDKQWVKWINKYYSKNTNEHYSS